MKKHSIGSRILALLLTLVMVVSAIPTSVFAAIGDIGTGINAGKTGITAGTLNQDGAINWPVKIYDYLNDGMLFEPANSRADVASAASMVYGGGRVMPKTTLGTDYTVNAAFSEFAYTWTTSRLATEATGTSKGGNYVLTRKTAVRFEDPQYLHISYPGPGTYNMMMLRSFTNTPPSAAQTKADIRFMTIVYRANGIDSDERIDIKLESPSGTTYSYYGFADEDTNGADLVNTDTWKYLVIDLQAALDIRWESVASVTGVYLTSDMNDSGDYIDLSHVAFFSNVTEAAHYGEDAAAFSNDPGEYLVDSQTVTLAEGTPIYYTYPTDDEPGYDLGLNKTVLTLSGGQASSKIRFGMNFALGYAQSTATYARWASGATVSLNSGGLKLNSAQMNVSNTDNGNRDYVTLSSTASSSNIILSEFAEGADTGTTLYTGWNGDRVRYLVLVYRATGYNTSDQPDQMKFWLTGYTAPATPTTSANAFSYPDGTAATNFSVATYNNIQVADGWVSATIDLYTIAKQSYIKYVGMNFPTGTGKKLDLAYVGYFVDSDSASEFATSATAYMNQGIRVQTGTSGGESVNIKANRSWNMGNNLGYGLLFSSDGPGWTNLAGGNNTNPNGYYAYAIGYDLRNSTTTATSKAAVNANRIDFDGNKDSDSSSNIYLLKAEDTSDGTTADGYDMKDLTFDGYNLLQKVTSGWLTAGMLEGSLVDGKPVYRQETVEYLGRLLYNTLVIPPFDADGDYNYNFVKGEKSAQFAWDINGDNDLSDSFDLTGDGYAETSEASMDLATALRLRLGVTFTLKQDKGTYEKGNAALGTYEDTLTKADDLMGEFSDVREHIETCVDAAYFLLNNIFVDNSYNQLQDDYGYLVLSSAKVENSDGTTKDAYVFDAGFSTGTSGNETAAGYIEDSQSSLIYSPYVKEENGTAVVGNGTISLNNVNSKDMVSIDANGTSFTTRFPFLPVTDPEGDYPHDTETYYFADDGVRTYIEEGETYENRNYNYVLASNGEFVYYEDDNLFFDFEGDDDV